MTIEVVKYIGDFQPNLPGEIDFIDEGDNHIQNLKIGYKNSFPNFNSELSYSNTELNTIREYLTGNTNEFLWNRPFPLVTGQVAPSDYILGFKATGELSLTNDMLPIGSIVPSWLPFETFTKLYKYGTGNSDYHFTLCNGGSLTGTTLNRILGVDPYILPDLQNKYLRQAITEANLAKPQTEQVKITAWTLPNVTLPAITTDNGTSTDHSHQSGVGTGYYWGACFTEPQNASNIFPPTGGAGNRQGWFTNKDCAGGARLRSNDTYNVINFADHTHTLAAKLITLTTAITTGAETRPTSVCLNYYIRVE